MSENRYHDCPKGHSILCPECETERYERLMRSETMKLMEKSDKGESQGETSQ
jgi:hypothetical protein